MIAAERRAHIINKLRHERVVSVHELAVEFSTTEMTIRRDLALLEQEDLITRSYGGAVFNEKVGYESEFSTRQTEGKGIKAIIGREAAKLVTPGDSIGIDVGTTALEVAKQLKEVPNITVITTSIPVVNELCATPNLKVVCAGGELSPKDLSLTGHTAINTLKEYVLDKVFIGVAGISFDHGYTAFNMKDALVKRVFIEQAQEVVIVSHSDKIGLARHASICALEGASKFITDSGISQKDLRNLENRGIEVIVVEGDPAAPTK